MIFFCNNHGHTLKTDPLGHRMESLADTKQCLPRLSDSERRFLNIEVLTFRIYAIEAVQRIVILCKPGAGMTYASSRNQGMLGIFPNATLMFQFLH